MKKIHILLRKVFKIIPYKCLTKLYLENKILFLTDDISSVYYERFFKESPILNTDEFLSEIKKFNKVMMINSGEWNYKVINFNFVRCMISLIILSLENGYLPYINIPPSETSVIKECNNLWTKMFKQPIINQEEISQFKIRNCSLNGSIIRPSFFDATNGERISIWHNIVSHFVIYNDNCQNYINEEIEILNSKKVLGVLVRGTDYTDTKPSGHPIQPDANELLVKVREIMKKDDCEYIYLATEEKMYSEIFRKEFPNKVLENKRKYFDKLYYESHCNRVSQVNFGREDDDFLKSLEYMSSINILSNCYSLVAGLCGGSEFAIYMNGNKYRTCYLFNKGVYK